MKAEALSGKNVVIWGTGREGMAAAAFIRARAKDARITFVDEATGGNIAPALAQADVIVKSPGVSLYHPLLKGRAVTSLMNLWFAQDHAAKTVCITGTKGKSTTSALLGHVLRKAGARVEVVGNIGVPISEAPEDSQVLVIETSSYQAANFDGRCDIAAVTSLYPEHLDWHGDWESYARDKLHLLGQAAHKILHAQAAGAGVAYPKSSEIVEDFVGAIPNAYLARAHNRGNVAVVLAVVRALGYDADAALAAMVDFQGLPHRQQELGTRANVVYVDDSIATTPQAAIAAMEVYKGRAITLIAGGHDRGIDYAPLVDYVRGHNIGLVTLGPAGARIRAAAGGSAAQDMVDAVAQARGMTPSGGVILLSPAAPSFGLFKNYAERGEAFARESGF
ncbi:MAG: UDP-N-acetylmuramoyl-L-alanine--D-glutamate ligase [Rhodospirillales bacterium]|nr:UDP-N-acetylmuramoyl-L-alanine--D-glutamate ligase [Alphaproteobacteria bacterium]MCB9986985.1 UDP-N-acetylmuramoyl-L-alanine--D-glutamate ligase [Rhodospirillales bacterium]USO08241.1 MAG: UDP-N-acetylmuramoyl-L-alanine--D-glutamate ligase [Rhodospirillales bacterium]